MPLYVHASPHGPLAIGTRSDYFVRFLHGVSLIERGHFLRVERVVAADGGDYWDPRPHEDERLKPDPERPAQLRAILLDTLARDLDSSGGNLLTLSGGVDCSSLGALAAGTLGMPLAALSLLSADRASRTRDERYIDALTARFRLEPHLRVVLDLAKQFDLLERPTRSCFQIVHPALCMLEEMRDLCPVRVMVGGEYADEVVGTLASLADWAAHTSLRELHRAGSSGGPGETPRDLLRWGKRRMQQALRRPRLPFPDELPEFVRSEVRLEYADWLAGRRREAGRDRRPLRHLALTGEHDGFVAMNWEAATALDVRRSLPFFNREALELAYACHPSEQLGPGTKKLLRAALRDDVPAENLQRKDKGSTPRPPEATIAWTPELDQLLEPIVREDWFPNPPKQVDQWDARGLAPLMQIARNVGVCAAQSLVATS